jgi:hypothetical protein
MGDVVIYVSREEVQRVTHKQLVADGYREKEPFLGITVDVRVGPPGTKGGILFHVGHDERGDAYIYGPHGNVSFLTPRPEDASETEQEDSSKPWFQEERWYETLHLHIVHEADNGQEQWSGPEIDENKNGHRRRLFGFLER